MSIEVEKSLQEHYKLFDIPMSKIGEMHYQILESDMMVDKQKEEDEGFKTEIGRDEIHWWVYRKEKDLNDFKNRTENALVSFQKMKEDSVKLRQFLQPKRYSELIYGIRNFCVQHESEIQALQNYVKWLAEKDPRAPSILFTYRVWGSTRLGERTIPISKQEKKIVVNACIETTLGLRMWFHGPTLARTFSDVQYEKFESMQPEDYSTPVIIPEDVVVSRASNEILSNMSEYFECLRNSLRNILLEIEEFETSENILHSNKFWESFVRKVMTLPVETMKWDFKRTLGMWEAKGNDKKKKEREFCEDVGMHV